MIDHAKLIRSAGKAREVAERHGVSIHTVHSWVQRGAIPAEHWSQFAKTGLVTVQQLADDLAARHE